MFYVFFLFCFGLQGFLKCFFLGGGVKVVVCFNVFFIFLGVVLKFVLFFFGFLKQVFFDLVSNAFGCKALFLFCFAVCSLYSVNWSDDFKEVLEAYVCFAPCVIFQDIPAW